MRDEASEIPRPRRTAPWRLLLAQVTHFFTVMLWIAVGLALLAGVASLAAAVIGIVVPRSLSRCSPRSWRPRSCSIKSQPTQYLTTNAKRRP